MLKSLGNWIITTKPKVKANFSNILIVSFIYTLLFHLPILCHRFAIIRQFSNTYDALSTAFIELLLAGLLTIILFGLLRSIKTLYALFIPLFFILGGISNYYVWDFGKSFDIGVLQDILAVEWDMTQSYLSLKLIAFIITSLGLGILSNRLQFKLFKSRISKLCLLLLTVVFITALLVDYSKYSFYKSKTVLQTYIPFSVIYNFGMFIKDYNTSEQIKNNKLDIASHFKHSFVKTSEEPLLVVMVIGESARGDMFGLNARSKYKNTPLLAKQKNLISFAHATASSTSTKVSLPFMLTRAKSNDWERAISETSIISVFKHLGFQTHWIGAQGAFGICDNSYAPIIMEADSSIIKSDIRRDFSEEYILDEHLLPYLDNALKTQRNTFIVLHMYGSHWRFEERYPAAFRKNTPVCNSKSPGDCSKEELINSYNNTILYSDWVLSEFINRFKHKNAIMFFASDHGFSLYENNNIFGNAYQGDNPPKEQLDIAMFAWASDKFIKQHHHNFKNLATRQYDSVSHDHLFHSLLGCIDIQSEVVEKGLNLCH
jgi:lipid A ethanolaminephosphotransferase